MVEMARIPIDHPNPWEVHTPLIICHRAIKPLSDIVIGIMVVVAPSENVTFKPVGDSHKGPLNNRGKPTFFQKTKRKRI
jgi:hypothetical protein